jgi:hypothetical protein
MRKFLACSIVGLAVFGGALVACSSGGSSGSQAAFCDAVKKDKATFSQLSDQSDLNNSQSLAVVTAAFNDLKNKAPAEIKDDMNTLANAVKDLGSITKAFSSAAKTGNFSDLSSVEKSFSDQHKGLDQAAKNVEKYAKDKCGVDLSSDTSSSSSSSSSRSSKSSSSDNFSDLSNFSDFSNLSDLSSSLSSAFSNFSDLSSLTSAFSDFSNFSDLSSLFSR